MGLPHRDRDPRRPTAAQLAKARVATALREALDVLVPQDLQRDVLSLQLAVKRGPVWLGATAVALLGADRREELRLQRGIG